MSTETTETTEYPAGAGILRAHLRALARRATAEAITAAAEAVAALAWHYATTTTSEQHLARALEGMIDAAVAAAPAAPAAIGRLLRSRSRDLARHALADQADWRSCAQADREPPAPRAPALAAGILREVLAADLGPAMAARGYDLGGRAIRSPGCVRVEWIADPRNPHKTHVWRVYRDGHRVANQLIAGRLEYPRWHRMTCRWRSEYLPGAQVETHGD